MGEPKTFRDGVFVIPSDGDPPRYEVTCEPGDFTTEIGRELIGGKVDLGDGKARRITGAPRHRRFSVQWQDGYPARIRANVDINAVIPLTTFIHTPFEPEWFKPAPIPFAADWPPALELTPERIAQMKEEMSDPEAYQQQVAGVPLRPYCEQSHLRSAGDSVKDWKASDYAMMAELFGPEVTNG